MTRSLTLAAVALAAWAFPSGALAGPDQEMILQDEPKVVHARSVAELRETLQTIKDLGTDRLRVMVFWGQVAPDAKSEQRPDFGEHGAADPRSYPSASWQRYDRIVQIADELDLGLLFTVSGPGPAWADQTRRGRAGIARPDAAAFGDFVEAVGRRYSGRWPADGSLPGPWRGGWRGWTTGRCGTSRTSPAG